MLLRMFSTDVAEREEQPSQVWTKQSLTGVFILSNTLAGKVTKEEQFLHDLEKSLQLAKSIYGKAVKLLQFSQACLTFVIEVASVNPPKDDILFPFHPYSALKG